MQRHYDLAVIGGGLSGLVSAALLAAQGASVLVFTGSDGESDDGEAVHFPFFQYQRGDIWDLFFHHLGARPPPELSREHIDGDPAWTFMSRDALIHFCHGARAHHILAATNSFIPDHFTDVINALCESYVLDRDHLAYRTWPDLFSSDALATPPFYFLNQRLDSAKTVRVPDSWLWRRWFDAISPLFGMPTSHNQNHFFAAPFQLMAPKSFRLVRGSRSLETFLLSFIRHHGGRLSTLATCADLRIERGRATELIMNGPLGGARIHSLLLNTSIDNLTRLVPGFLKKKLRFVASNFESAPPPFPFDTMRVGRVDERVASFVSLPLIGVDMPRPDAPTPEAFYIFFKNTGCGEFLTNAFDRPPSIFQSLLGFSRADESTKAASAAASAARTWRFAREGRTGCANIRYVHTTPFIRCGPVGQLIEGLWHAQWAYGWAYA